MEAIVLLGIPLVLEASSIDPFPMAARAFKTSFSPWLRISSNPENGGHLLIAHRVIDISPYINSSYGILKKRLLRDIVLQRIEILRELSIKAAREGDIELALASGDLIFRLAMRNSINIPRDIKRIFCERCRAPLIPGLTATVRLRGKGRAVVRVVTCHICGNIHRLEILKDI
ncbi:MAG: hypothetical protein RQ885_01825 [Desulfurococcales archaeon]|jgi:ribonuclease P protein subunit RPR2|nr:hypothetical protein [Desulfurococcales archaeon]